MRSSRLATMYHVLPALLALPLLALALLHVAGSRWVRQFESREDRSAVTRVVADVEAFRRAHGRVPTRDEVTLPANDHVVYEVRSDGTYEVGFGWGFDDYCFYDSATGRARWIGEP